MKKRRRRGIRSDWIDALQATRSAMELRRERQQDAMRDGPILCAQGQRSSRTVPDSTPTDEAGRDESGIEAQPAGCHATSMENDEYSTHRICPELDENMETPETEGSADNEEAREMMNDFQPFPFEERRNHNINERSAPGVCENTNQLQVPDVGRDIGFSEPIDITIGIEEERDPDLGMLEEQRLEWENRLKLTALLAIVGSVRYTVNQYEYTRGILADCGHDNTWPPYSSSQRLFEAIIKSCLPKSRIVFLNVKNRSAPNGILTGQPAESGYASIVPENSAEEGTAREENMGKEKVRVFLPSSWAKLDVATSTVFNEMFPVQPDETWPDTHPLEFSELVQNRDLVVNSCDRLFVRYGDHSIPCDPGSSVDVMVTGDHSSFQSSFRITSNGGGYILKGIVTATWCVGASTQSNPSGKRAIDIESLNSEQKCIINFLSTALSPSSREADNSSPVLPGDICTLLSSGQTSNEGGHVPVIVHRFWRYEDGMPSIMLVWLRVCRSPQSEQRKIQDPAITHVVSTISLGRQNPIPTSHMPTPDSYTKCRGELQGGGKYVVYRILLYCDDFQRSSQMNASGSAGGCYFLPLSLPPEARRNTSSVRIISLTPPGVSTNEVLHFIVEDLVRASTVGIPGRTPTGDEVRIFIDVVGFIGDYPASSGAADVIGHVGRAPCTLCSFRRLQETDTDGSKFGYTTTVHAGNSTFLRHGERHLSLRRSEISPADANRLGMVDARRVGNLDCPLLYLQRALDAHRSRIPRTVDGNLVTPGIFDAYRSNAVAPDHLLTGLSKDILTVIFKFLPSDQIRFQFDVYLCEALRDNGLLPQKEVFNVHKKAIHSMTLSEIFCVMLVAVPVQRIITCRTHRDHIIQEAALLLTKLQRLIAFTYWWPQSELDGEDAVRLVHETRNRYHSELKKKSKEYVKAVDKLCRRNSIMRSHLDKPNLHRLIELYEHTVPAFGHVREFMELVFESAHQPLKRSIARSNNHDAHIFAVEHCVGNDWQGRLAALRNEALHGSPSAKAAAKRGIRRLLLGEEADCLDEKGHHQFIVRTDETLEHLFTPTVQKQFQKDGMIGNFSLPKRSVWKGRTITNITTLCRIIGIEMNVLQSVITLSKRWIDAVCPPMPDEVGPTPPINLFQKAKRVKLSESGRQIGKPSAFDCVGPNTAVQLYMEPSQTTRKVLFSSNPSRGKPVFFAVVAVLQRNEDHAWAVCVRCNCTGDELQTIAKLDSGSFQILLLTPSVRRISLYHICQEANGPPMTCKIDAKRRKVIHCSSLLGGSRMYLQRRVNGYPPRMA